MQAFRPRIGWHVDPSGHALVTPTLFALLSYDALVIDRIPAYIKQGEEGCSAALALPCRGHSHPATPSPLLQPTSATRPCSSCGRGWRRT